MAQSPKESAPPRAKAAKRPGQFPGLRAAIRDMREQYGYTQEKLANEVNSRDKASGTVDKTTVSKWETGTQHVPDYALPILESIFDCPGVLKAILHNDRFPDLINARKYDATIHLFYPAMLACDLRCPEDSDVPAGRFEYVPAKRMRHFDRNRTVYFFDFRAVVLHEQIELTDATLAMIYGAIRSAKDAARQMLSSSLREYCNVAPDLVRTVPFARSMVEIRADRPADEISRTLQLLAAPSVIKILLADPAWDADLELATLNDISTTTGMHPFNIAAVQTGWATEEGVAFHQRGMDRSFTPFAADLMIQLQALRRYATFVADTKTVTSDAHGPDFFDEAADRIESPTLDDDRFRERQLVRAVSEAFEVRRMAREAMDELREAR